MATSLRFFSRPLVLLIAAQIIFFLAGSPGDLPLEDEAIGYSGRAQAILVEKRLPHWTYSPLYSFWYLPYVALTNPPTAILISNLLLRVLGVTACWALMARVFSRPLAFAICLWWSLLEVHIGIPVGVNLFSNVLILCAAWATVWKGGPLLLRGFAAFWCLLGAGFARPELFPVLPAFCLGIAWIHWNRRNLILARIKREAARPTLVLLGLLPLALFAGWFTLRRLGWDVDTAGARFFVTVLCFYPHEDLNGVNSLTEALWLHPQSIIGYMVRNAGDLPAALALTLVLPSRLLSAGPFLYVVFKWGAIGLILFFTYRLLQRSDLRGASLQWVGENRNVLLLFGLAAAAALPMAILLSPQRRFLTSMTPLAGLLAGGLILILLSSAKPEAVRRMKILGGLAAVFLIGFAAVQIPGRFETQHSNQDTYRILKTRLIPHGKMAGNVAPHYRSLLGLSAVGHEPSIGRCLDDPSCFAVVIHPEIAGNTKDPALSRLPKENWSALSQGVQTVWIRPEKNMDITSNAHRTGQ